MPTTESISVAVVEPDLHAHARGLVVDPEQVVGDREALRLRVGRASPALRAGGEDVAPVGCADVPGHAGLAPTEVIGRGEVDELVEAELVAQVDACLGEPGRVDDERRLPVRLALLDETGNGVVRRHAYSATPRIR